MRQEVTIRTLYTFDELSDEAKEKAIENLWDINVDYDWWKSTYDDANEIQCRIDSFDVDRGSSIGTMKIKVWIYTWDIEEETDSMVFNNHADALAKIMESASDHYASKYADDRLKRSLMSLEMRLVGGADPVDVENQFNELVESRAGFWGDDYHGIQEVEIDIPGIQPIEIESEAERLTREIKEFWNEHTQEEVRASAALMSHIYALEADLDMLLNDEQ